MGEDLFFDGRLDDVADYVAQVLECLGQRFGSGLIEAAIHEALTNAVIYGALGIDPAQHGPDRELETLLASVVVAQGALPTRGRIHVCIQTDPPPDAVVSITDPGAGFDWRLWRRTLRAVASPTTSWSNVPLAGRGLVIMHAGSKALWWNDAGNQVNMQFAPSSRSAARDGLLRRLHAVRDRVLVVDDEPASRVALRRMIQDIGYEVRECDELEAALEEVNGWRPVLVLVHARMSDARGLLLVEKISSSSCGTVVAFTTGPDRDAATAALHAGAFDCLQLPIWSSELVERLRRALRQPAARS